MHHLQWRWRGHHKGTDEEECEVTLDQMRLVERIELYCDRPVPWPVNQQQVAVGGTDIRLVQRQPVVVNDLPQGTGLSWN